MRSLRDWWEKYDKARILIEAGKVRKEDMQSEFGYTLLQQCCLFKY